MSDSLSETKACDLLSRLFRARGYTIARNVLFREYGVEFHVDGWDAKARVGFEFLSSEDEDHIDLSLEEYQTLSDAQRRGELALFIIDEVEPLSAADLVAEAGDFLDEAEAVIRARRSRGPKAGAAGGRPGKKPGGSAAVAPKKGPRAGIALKKAAATKTAGKKTGGTKSAAARAAAGQAGGKRPGGKKPGGKKPAASTGGGRKARRRKPGGTR